MAQITVEIVTPERRIVSDQFDEAIVPGSPGLFGVRAGHAPFLSLVEPGLVTLKKGSSLQNFFVAGGFVEVLADRVSILADEAEPTFEIDVEAARKRWEASREKLKGLNTGDPQFQIESATVRREAARMSAAGHR